MGTENDEELYKRQQAIEGERVRQEAAQRAKELEEFRKAEEQRKADEAARKAAEGKMIADTPPAAGWPDIEVPAAPRLRDQVAGAVGVGPAADAALAAKLLNSAQRPLDSVSVPAKDADGGKERTSGPPASKPALGLG
jgi:hypothetical protein